SLRKRRRQTAVGGLSPQPVHQRPIAVLVQPHQKTPDMAVGHPQPAPPFPFPPPLLLHPLAHPPAIPPPLAQCNALQFHRPPPARWNRTFLFCTTRTFSFCGDMCLALLDFHTTFCYSSADFILLSRSPGKRLCLRTVEEQSMLTGKMVFASG